MSATLSSNRTVRRRRALALATALPLLIATAPSAAAIERRVVTDARGDAPPSIDISRAVFRNGPARVVVGIKVPQLRDSGVFRLEITPPADGDQFLYARVWKRADGRLRTRFSYVSNEVDDPRPCDVAAAWRKGRGLVRISVPHRCITGHFRTPALILSAAAELARTVEETRPIRVRRCP